MLTPTDIHYIVGFLSQAAGPDDVEIEPVAITALRFTGTLERRFEELPSVTKALYKLGSSEPIAGCAISDSGGEFGLMALIILESPHSRTRAGADCGSQQTQDRWSIGSSGRLGRVVVGD